MRAKSLLDSLDAEYKAVELDELSKWDFSLFSIHEMKRKG